MNKYATITGMKKWLVLGAGLLATFILILGLVFVMVGRKKAKVVESNAVQITGSDSISLTGENPAPASDPVPTEAPAGGTVRLVAAGDFIAHDAINARAKEKSYDYASFTQDVLPVFEKSDLRYCTQSTPAGGDAFGISGYPTYNAPLQWVEALAKLKCNLVNLASDHSNDKGQGAIDANVAEWKKYGDVVKTGMFSSQEEHDAISYANVGSLKVAFLAYTTTSAKPPGNSFGVNLYSQELAGRQITQAKEAGAKFIIVGMRWGAEYAADNNAAQAAEAQFLANQGVDLILGGGPHVMQPVQKLNREGGGETVVWYSLGNFLHSQLEPETNVNCLAVMDIDAATSKITSLGCLPVYSHYEWPAAEEAKGNLLGRTNFKVVLADKAGEIFPSGYLSKKTSLQAQVDRLKNVANKKTEVKMLTSADFGL